MVNKFNKFMVIAGLALVASCSQSDFSSGSKNSAERHPTPTSDANPKTPQVDDLKNPGGPVDPKVEEIVPPEVVVSEDGKSVSKQYTGGCIGVRHGGSLSAADKMNQNYDPKYEATCKLTFDLSKDFGGAEVGKSKIEVSFINGVIPQIGKTYKEGAQIINNTNFACKSANSTNALFGNKTASITALEKSYTDSNQVIGSNNKGGKWSIEFDPATKVLTLSTVANGWGKCRYDGNCGACIQSGVVKLTAD
jgi:hypothetical protein